MSEQTDKSSDGHAFVFSACVRIVLMFDYVSAYFCVCTCLYICLYLMQFVANSHERYPSCGIMGEFAFFVAGWRFMPRGLADSSMLS